MSDEVREADLEPLAQDMQALSNPRRLRLIHLLTRPLYSEEIADALGIKRQSVTRHLDTLEERGFLRALNGRRPSGPVTEYHVVPQKIFATAMRLSRIAHLEPEGGPQVRHDDRTAVLDAPPADTAARVATGAAITSVAVASGPQAGKRLGLTGPQDRWTIGRDEDRDLVLKHDPYVSGRHADIRRTPRGFEAVDLMSVNGTYVNFQPLPKGERVPLEVGDILGIGHTTLVLQSAGAVLG